MLRKEVTPKIVYGKKSAHLTLNNQGLNNEVQTN